MGCSGTVLKFSITTVCKSLKLYLYSLLKNMSKLPISDLNKRRFFQILLYIQRATI